jgi:hypothetical protein
VIGRLYAAMWANFWTPSFWTLAAIAAGGWRHRVAMHKRLDELERRLGVMHPKAPPGEPSLPLDEFQDQW